MRSIVGMKAPYREIPKLPELREKFMSLYNEILEEQSAPVVKAIKDDRNRVLEVLNDKPTRTQSTVVTWSGSRSCWTVLCTATMCRCCAAIRISPMR